MVAINWKRDEVVEISGDLYRFRNRTKTGEINLQHVNDNHFVTMNEADLIAKWASGDLVRLVDPDRKLKKEHRDILEQPFVTLSEPVRDKATKRFTYLKAYVDRNLNRQSSKVLQPLIDEVANQNDDQDPPSPRKMRGWLKAWFDIGSPDLRDVRCLAPRYHLRGNRWGRFDPEVVDILLETIDEKWLVPNRASTPALHQLALARINKLDTEGREKRFLEPSGELRKPSLRTVYRFVESLDEDLVVEGQDGYLEFDRQCKPVSRGPEATRPLQEVEIDHTLLDVIVLDTKRQVPLGRPWITAAIDRYTRMIIGVHIGFESPSAHSVMLCLRNAIRPKTWLRNVYPDIDNDWPCFGIPQSIVVDNGPEFHGRSFKEACLSLGMDIVYCPARKPRYKGKIERFFLTLMRQCLHSIPGTTFSNTKQRGHYNPEKEAIMTLGDLKGSVLKWIVDLYSQSKHRRLGCSPAKKWEESVMQFPVSLPQRAADLDILLNHVVDRKLTRRGIEFQGLMYSCNSPAFRTLINRGDKPDAVKVRINAADLSSVFVEDWVTGRFFEVPSIDPEFTNGLSLAEHSLVKQKAKEDMAPGERVRIGKLIQAQEDLHNKFRLLEDKKMFSSKRLYNVLGEIDVPDETEEPEAMVRPSSFDLETPMDEEDEVAEEATRARPQKRSKPKSPRTPPKPTERHAPKPPATANENAVLPDDDDDESFAEASASFGIQAEFIS